MLRITRQAALPALALVALLLSGCAPELVEPAPPSVEADAPVFESDEEALEAAEVALGEYWAVANAVFQDGGEGVERLEGLVTSERFEESVLSADEFQARGWHQVGDVTFGSTTLQRHESIDEVPQVVVMTCLIYIETYVVAESGAVVDRLDDADSAPFEFTFVVDKGSPPKLRLAETEKWPTQIC